MMKINEFLAKLQNLNYASLNLDFSPFTTLLSEDEKIAWNEIVLSTNEAKTNLEWYKMLKDFTIKHEIKDLISKFDAIDKKYAKHWNELEFLQIVQWFNDLKQMIDHKWQKAVDLSISSINANDSLKKSIALKHLKAINKEFKPLTKEINSKKANRVESLKKIKETVKK